LGNIHRVPLDARNYTRKMNPLTIAKGKVTKIGVGIAAAGPILESFIITLRGGEWQGLVQAAESGLSSVTVLIGAAVAFWGALRAAFNYGGR
jgi:hypothetical protein